MAELSDAEKNEVELMILSKQEKWEEKMEKMPINIAKETAKLISQEKMMCPAFHISTDTSKWDAILAAPKELNRHIEKHVNKEKWFRFTVATVIALFGFTITLMTFLLKAIQSAMILLKMHN